MYFFFCAPSVHPSACPSPPCLLRSAPACVYLVLYNSVICVCSCIHHWSQDPRNFHLHTRLLVWSFYNHSTSCLSPSPQSLATTNVSSISTSLSFQKSYINGIIQYGISCLESGEYMVLVNSFKVNRQNLWKEDTGLSYLMNKTAIFNERHPEHMVLR